MILSILSVVCISIVISFSINSKESNIFEVNVSQLEEIQKKDKIFALYVGRPTCPHCSIFYNKLKKIKNNDIKIYYLNSITNYDDSPKEIKDFRDKYNIMFVPDFKIFKGNDIILNLEIDDKITIKEIENF